MIDGRRAAGCCGLLAVAATGLLGALPAAAVVETVRVASGLTRPVFATAPPDDHSS